MPIVDAVPVGEFEDLDKVMVRPARRPDAGTGGPDLTELGVPGAERRIDDGGRQAAEERSLPVGRGSGTAAAGGPGSPAWWRGGRPGGGRRPAGRQGQALHTDPPGAVLVGKTLAQATQAVHRDHFTVRPTGHAYSITLGSRTDREPGAGTAPGGQTGDPQAGVDHRRRAVLGAAAGGHSQPDHLLHLRPGRPGAAVGPSGRGLPAVRRPVQLDGGGRRRAVTTPDRHRPVRVDGDHRPLQGPRPGGRPDRHRPPGPPTPPPPPP